MLVEVVVAMMLLTLVVFGVAGAGLLTSVQLRQAQIRVRSSQAAQQAMEALLSLGYDSISAGSDTVGGFPLTWTVQGTSPKRVVMLVERQTSTYQLRPDTFVTYVSEW